MNHQFHVIIVIMNATLLIVTNVRACWVDGREDCRLRDPAMDVPGSILSQQ
jgi:hypothetical protein